MGIRPSAETNSGDGNQLAVDQIGEVYANVKAVGENIDKVIIVSQMDAADMAAVADNIANIIAAVGAATNAAISETNAANSATAAATSAANALTYRNTAQTAATNAATSETTTLGYRNTAQTYMNSASASAIAAATSEANALTYKNAAQTSATAAATSETNAAASAAAALTAKNAAETAETNAELAETNAEAAQAAAYAAQLAAEAARDEAESIAGGDIVTGAEFDAGMALKVNKAGDTMTGKLNMLPSAPSGAGFNIGVASGAPSAPVDGDMWMSTGGLFYRRNSFSYTLMTTSGGTFSGDINVPDEAYGAPWNGSLEAPTKNAVYDEIEALKGLVVGAMVYKGTWNATTNTPAIPAAAAANKGWFYKVATAGSTNIGGITDWQIGDWIVSNGTAWDKIDNTEIVSSVAGKTGAVTLVKGDVGLGNVDNTSDASKPVSTAQQTALDLKLDKAGGSMTNNLTLTTASGSVIWNDGTDNGRIYMNSGGAVYRSALHLFRNAAGSTDYARIDATELLVYTGQITVTDPTRAELILTDSGSVVNANIYNDGNLHILCTPRIWTDSDIQTFRNAAGSVTYLNLSAGVAAFTGAISTTSDITTTGAAAGVQLGDRDLTGSLTLYNSGDVFRVYINGADRFSVSNTGGVSAADLALTKTGADPTISLLRTGGNTCYVKADANTVYLTGPVTALRAATHYLQTEDGATTMVTTTLNGGNPKMTMGPSGSTATATPTQIDLGGTFTNSPGNNAKLLIHNAGYGLGVSSGAFENLAPSGAKYVWYINAANEMELTTTGLTVNGTVTATSDRRRKKKIKTVRNALDAVCRMRGVTFEWRKTNLKSAGVIAQEHQEVAPEAVHVDDKGFLSVNDAATTAYLIEAIKELKGIVDAQAARIAELEAR